MEILFIVLVIDMEIDNNSYIGIENGYTTGGGLLFTGMTVFPIFS